MIHTNSDAGFVMLGRTTTANNAKRRGGNTMTGLEAENQLLRENIAMLEAINRELENRLRIAERERDKFTNKAIYLID